MLNPGTKLGPYEIVAPLGAGGMGEVYRARDTRLERTVAIKVLSSHLSGNPEVRQRFEREARAVSSLSHPHICTLYDIGHQDGVDFLVMEYLEGETLAQRLAKGPFPLDELLRCAMQVTDALHTAHRQGLIHRDLKPGNIMLTASGAKLLDFGLAKAAGLAPAISDLSSSPTISRPLTAEGAIVGTFQYMAPEQLEGKEADSRSDIFALGAMLYEMATGKKAFEGRSQASLIAAILREDPRPISALAPMAPPALDRAVKICLAKDPEERWQTAHDLKLQLEWIAEGGSQAGVPAPVVARRRSRERFTWVAAAIALLVGAAGLAGTLYYRSEARLTGRTVRSQILAAEKTVFDFIPVGAPAAVSPDGQWIVFGGRDSSGKRLLWVRSLDALTAQPLAGTDGATYPFWSPDSHHLGFFANGKLKKIEASGGPVLTLCDVGEARGGTWSRDDVIVFTPAATDSLYRVAAAGGTPTQVTKLDKGATSHRWPQFLPDGRHFLYTSQGQLGIGGEDTGIHVGSLDSTEQRRVLPDVSNAAYAPPGYLLFWRQQHLMAQPFDAKSLKLTADAFPVAEQVQFAGGFSIGVFSISQNGVLVYQSGSTATSQLRWFDPSGKETATGAPGSYTSLRLSPDGKRLVVSIADLQAGTTDLWLDDLGRNVRTRFTFTTSERALNWFPVWSPDGSRIVFASNRKNPSDLYVKPASMAADEETLLEGQTIKRPTDWSRDGRYITYNQNDGAGKTNWDIWILPLSGDHKPFPFLQTRFNEMAGMFSPDGRWMAYQSDESGSFEVYVAPFPGPGGKFQVSTGGGRVPAWSSDGKQLFFLGPDKLMAVDIKLGPSAQLGTPRPMFATRVPTGVSGARVYDVAPGTRRFLMLEVGETPSEPLTLVVNWTANIKEK